MNTPIVAPVSATEENLPPLPRINVQAFCETPQAAPVLQAVAADRRMSRAHMDVYSGGIPAAIQYYSQTTTPQLLVVESSKPREGLLADLAGLAQVCSAETRVIVLGHVNDISLYRELLAQGLSDYLAAPFSPQQILASFSALFGNGEAAKLGKVVSFMGAKGGVGSSFLAHNVAWLLSSEYKADTVIADLDLAFGTAGLDFNLDPAQGILEALSSADRIDPIFIDRLLTKCSDRLLLLASPSSVHDSVNIEEETLEIIIDVLRTSTPFTILDLPSTWDKWMKSVLIQSDKLVIVATPELASLRNTKSLADTIKGLRPNDEPPILILNQVQMGKRPEIPAAEFARAAGLEISLSIPFDAQTFGQAATNGQMIPQIAPKSQAAEILEQAAALIFNGEIKSTEKKGSSFLKPLLDKLGKKEKK